MNYTQISEKLGKDKSSVSREFARNSRKDGTYSANHADKLYAERRKNCGRKPILAVDEQAKITLLKGLNRDGLPNKLRDAQSWKAAVQPFVPDYLQGDRQRHTPQMSEKNYAFQM